MKSGFKTPQQIAFADMAKGLMDGFKLKQTDIARLARVSASMVSQIMSGDRSPRQASLELLRREYESLMSGERKKPAHEEDDPHKILDAFQDRMPAEYNAAKVMLKALYKDASSKLTAEEERALNTAEDVADHERAKSTQKPEAGGPTAQKRGPSRGASKGSKEQPEPPERAPK